jgi:hypothetical protein
MWCSRDLQDERVCITSLLNIVAETVSDSKAVPCNFEDAVFMEISDSKHHGCLVCNSGVHSKIELLFHCASHDHRQDNTYFRIRFIETRVTLAKLRS